MPELTLNPFAELELAVDLRAQRPGRPDFDRTEVEPLVVTLRTAQQEIAAALRDGSRSAKEQAEARAARGIDAFAEGTARFVERHEANAEKAIMGPRVDTSRDAEIRAWASGKPPAERLKIYYRALQNGDWETVHAFETAPKCFGLMDGVDPERARALKLEALPAETRAEFDAARRRIAAYQHVTDVARRVLRQLAGER